MKYSKGRERPKQRREMSLSVDDRNFRADVNFRMSTCVLGLFWSGNVVGRSCFDVRS